MRDQQLGEDNGVGGALVLHDEDLRQPLLRKRAGPMLLPVVGDGGPKLLLLEALGPELIALLGEKTDPPHEADDHLQRAVVEGRGIHREGFQIGPLNDS